MIWVSKDLRHLVDSSGMLADEVTILGTVFRRLSPAMWGKVAGAAIRWGDAGAV